MSTRFARVLAGALAGAAAYVGVWATIWPHSFYTTFPGMGQEWVWHNGPYNEHFIRDVGGLYLALLVISAWAAWRDDAALLRAVGTAWVVFGVPHLAFHVMHRDGLSDAEWATSLTGLVATALAAALLVMTRSGPGIRTPSSRIPETVGR